ncbi:type II toxin-antitoxin system RatA family toxin [Halorussus litoreus]|uniref:type II toxin-antitoxin system RatA family toxin n=1 Tax=Halorussus litoreus TaxID=1710536 RepID=UPI000E221571|nr:SRPBCC family protein [Halorussus litoreus]
MDSVELSTVVYVPPEEAYEFLLDFEGYARYSEYLDRVERHGEGEVGTEYDIHLQWWKLNYTVRSAVTDTDPPERIDWRIVEDLHAHGAWVVEDAPEASVDEAPNAANDDAETPDDAEAASRVRLVIQFDPNSASSDMLDLPALVSLGWVVDKVRPLVLKEAEKVVARIVEDLEGERREVNLTLHESPDEI